MWEAPQVPPTFRRLCQSQRFGLATRGEPLADPYEGRIRSLMSPEITDRRGYELSDTYSGLQELWRGHYDHFNELLKQFLLQSYQETGDLLELLEVGAGAKSVLLRGLEETHRESTCPQAIQVHLVDPEPLGHIQSACLENSTLVAECQAAAKGHFKSIGDDRKISWRFTQEDFLPF